jgi:hypothetical protein
MAESNLAYPSDRIGALSSIDTIASNMRRVDSAADSALWFRDELIASRATYLWFRRHFELYRRELLRPPSKSATPVVQCHQELERHCAIHPPKAPLAGGQVRLPVSPCSLDLVLLPFCTSLPLTRIFSAIEARVPVHLTRKLWLSVSTQMTGAIYKEIARPGLLMRRAGRCVWNNK